ncbi:uncharacterized protein TNCV_1946841 [Trichonephila clavipes]|nr:uncharacterized protein TNCV_1946841 [Trichonephila clavipes]
MQSEIVITGISGRFPESDDVAEFSQKLYQKIDLVTDSKKRWEPAFFKPLAPRVLPPRDVEVKVTPLKCRHFKTLYAFVIKSLPTKRIQFAFSQRSSSPHLTEGKTFSDSDIINNLIDYEDGQEEPDFLRADKNMQESSFQTNWESIILK